jgi:hypothetical protein
MLKFDEKTIFDRAWQMLKDEYGHPPTDPNEVVAREAERKFIEVLSTHIAMKMLHSIFGRPGPGAVTGWDQTKLGDIDKFMKSLKDGLK